MKTTFKPTGQNIQSLRRIMDGNSVLVTGGTGSFGQAFVGYLRALTKPPHCFFA